MKFWNGGFFAPEDSGHYGTIPLYQYPVKCGSDRAGCFPFSVFAIPITVHFNGLNNPLWV